MQQQKNECDYCNLESSQVALKYNVSQHWMKKFAVLEKVNKHKDSKNNIVFTREYSKIIFNMWAFLFGPLYYLFKGMWRKAVSYTLLGMIIISTFEVILESSGVVDTSFLKYFIPSAFAVRANIDYYKKTVLDDNSWF